MSKINKEQNSTKGFSIQVYTEDFKNDYISKNKLEKEANLQRTQLNSYCNNKVKRIDLETIAKICYVLECKVEDIMDYVR